MLDVLQVLLDAYIRDEELHGYAIMRKAGLHGPSTYRCLDRLATAQLVEARWEILPLGDDRPRRRYYELSPDGVAVARRLLAERRPEVLDGLGRAQRELPSIPRRGFGTLFGSATRLGQGAP
jgi:PadR family transcriptional regulator, regulatory protein PadR